MTSRIRVLFVMADLRGGGAERATLNVIRHLDPARFEPTIFLLRSSGTYWSEVPSSARLEWGIGASGRILTRILPLLRKAISLSRNADVVVGALELLPSYVAYAAARVAGKGVVAWVHSDLRRHLPVYGAAQAHRVMIRTIYPGFRKIVFPSQAAIEGFQGLADIANDACELIDNPCDIELIAGRAAEPLPSWAVPIFRKPTILGVGALNNAIKGFDTLVRAHAIARSSGCDHNLVILGEGPDHKSLVQQAEQLQVANSAFVAGFEANPYPFMRAATAVAVPSRFEAFGLVVTEAMALGTPVIIASSARGSVEVIENGLHGNVFPAEDPDALATKIRDMIENRDLRDLYSKRGLERVRCFDSNQIVARWEQLLWQVAAGNSPGLGALPAE